MYWEFLSEQLDAAHVAAGAEEPKDILDFPGANVTYVDFGGG